MQKLYAILAVLGWIWFVVLFGYLFIRTRTRVTSIDGPTEEPKH